MALPPKPTIVPPPAPLPTRGEDPGTFSNNINALVAWYPVQTNNMQLTVDFVDAALDFTAAEADRAETAADVAQSASSVAHYKGEWGALSGALNIPASVWHLEQFWILLEPIADVAAHEPGTSSVWTVAAASSLANAHAVALSF